MANTVTLLLPTPQLAAIGANGNGAITGSIVLVLPLPRLATAGSPGGEGVTATLPTPVLVATGNTALVGNASLTLPLPELVASGEVTTVGVVALTLPTPVLSAYEPNSAAFTLPVPVLQASGSTGLVGSVQLVLPLPQLNASASIPFTGTSTLALPLPAFAARGTVGNIGAVAQTLRGLALAASGATGIVGLVDLVLPLQATLNNDWHGALTAYGGELASGAVLLTLPLLILRATGQTSAETPANPDGTVLPALVMHTETKSVWNYTNFPFNSLVQFNGAYLGASAEGLFVLAGSTDNGVPIQAAARLGMTDFGTSFLKRIDRCYVGYRADGDMVVRVYTDEVNVRDYLITAYGKSGLHGNHTRIGKGLAARYWQFEIRNQNGADFELNAFELKPTHLRRRIGGGDA